MKVINYTNREEIDSQRRELMSTLTEKTLINLEILGQVQEGD